MSGAVAADPAATSADRQHRPQLDGLRALFVLAVIVQHYAPQLCRTLPIGSIAVRLFFVLSGFLITGILLKCKRHADRTSRWFALRQFYARRCLRIFPLFYFVLIVGALAGIPPMRETMAWNATYLSNFLVARNGEFPGCVSHFWSLAVEEQFYLVWPFVILFVPSHVLPSVMVLLLLAAPLFRLALMHWTGNLITATVLTPACLDTLAAGAILAYYTQPQTKLSPRIVSLSLPIGLGLLLLSIAMRHWIWMDSGVALIGVWLIARGAEGFTGITGQLLQMRGLIYLGTISYGLYVYHNIIPVAVREGLMRMGVNEPRHRIVVPISLALTLLVASLSWFLLERPLNDLKRHFPYRRPTA